jgi:hypothetical protein
VASLATSCPTVHQISSHSWLLSLKKSLKTLWLKELLNSGTPHKMITTLMIMPNMIINQYWMMIKIMNHH